MCIHRDKIIGLTVMKGTRRWNNFKLVGSLVRIGCGWLVYGSEGIRHKRFGFNHVSVIQRYIQLVPSLRLHNCIFLNGLVFTVFFMLKAVEILYGLVLIQQAHFNGCRSDSHTIHVEIVIYGNRFCDSHNGQRLAGNQVRFNGIVFLVFILYIQVITPCKNK